MHFIQEQGADKQNLNKIFIGGLKDQITDQDLRTYFSQFGPIEKIETFMNKETGKRKGFAFISFGDYDAVDKCCCKYDLMRYMVIGLVPKTMISSI